MKDDKSRFRKLSVKILNCLLFLIFTLFGCEANAPENNRAESGESAEDAPYEADVIRLEGGDWGYPTPFAHYPRGPGGFKMCLVFDSLLERDEKGLIPWLAESYSTEEDGLAYRFKIRQGVFWQDGTPLTAKDVAFSLEYANRHAAVWSYIFGALESVEAENDHRVAVHLKEPHAAMIDNIGRTRIIPEHIWKTVDRPKEFTAPEAVIGSGPYRLTDYSKEHGAYRFEAFDKFWGPKQRIGSIEFVPVSEPVLAYEKREIDLVAITPDLLPRFEQDPAQKIVQSPAFWGYRLLFNMAEADCLREISVRKAIVYAIDRSELVEKIARGAAVPGSLGILPPDHVMAAEDVKAYEFDPARAGRLLDDAEYRPADGKGGGRLSPDGSPLALELLCGSQEVRMAELIRQRCDDVGISLSIRAVDPKTRDSRVRDGNYQLAILGHGGWGGDPDYLASRFSGSVLDQNAAPSISGLPGFEAPELMALLQRQRKEFDPVERRETFMEIQKSLAELVPELPLFYTIGYSVYRPEKYDGWMFMFDHHNLTHGKLSYLKREGAAAPDYRGAQGKGA